MTKGFKSIFNGTDFTGFAGDTDKYEIVDGVLRNKPKEGGTIFTEKEYSDFVARVEFRLPKAGNNGLAIRYPGTGDPAYSGMTELQILDSEHESYAKLDPSDSITVRLTAWRQQPVDTFARSASGIFKR